MTTDWKALCAELLGELCCFYKPWQLKEEDYSDAMKRARAALADEPAGPEGREPVSFTGRFTFPADGGEAGELAAELRHFIAGYLQMRGLDPEHVYSIHRGDAMEAHLRISRLSRIAELLEHPAPPHDPWKEVLLNALVCNFLLEKEHENDPKKALNDLIAWEKQLATDPLINPAPQLPAKGEAAELVVDELTRHLLTKAATEKANHCHYSATLLTRAADLLQRLSSPQPVPVSERLPEPNTKVLAYYFNSHGKGRTICAIWVPANSREVTGDDSISEPDEDYWPEGWYEQIENWEDLGWVNVYEGEVAYWQPLPKWPAYVLPLPEQEVSK